MIVKSGKGAVGITAIKFLVVSFGGKIGGVTLVA